MITALVVLLVASVAGPAVVHLWHRGSTEAARAGMREAIAKAEQLGAELERMREELAGARTSYADTIGRRDRELEQVRLELGRLEAQIAEQRSGAQQLADLGRRR